MRAGEVLGVAGVDGNGQTELEAVLAGIEAPDAGTVSLDGDALPHGSPRTGSTGGSRTSRPTATAPRSCGR